MLLMQYGGDELMAMAGARNYYRWILDSCRPYLGRILVEHGAGIGTFTRFLLAEDIQRLILIEPAANLLDFLRHGISPWQDKVQILNTGPVGK